MKNLIIRADDLGYTKAINYGIYQAVKNGIINNVGIMLNMDEAEHGANLLKEFDIDLGCHINVCAGKPISQPNQIPSLVQENGHFKKSKEYRESEKDLVVFDEAVVEIEAQYRRFISLFQRKPDYMDGHAISSDTFQKAIEKVAKKHGITYVANPSNSENVIYLNNKQVVLAMESMNSDYNPFEFMKRYMELSQDVLALLIFHPGFLDEDILTQSSLTRPRTKEVAMLTSQEIKDQLVQEEINLMRISQL